MGDLNEYGGIIVDIIGTNATNGGITSGKKVALLVDPKNPNFGPRLVKDHKHDMPVLIVLSCYTNKRHFMAFDAITLQSGMFGGHFIYTSDSRFPSEQPIHVHDRFEG
jgi:hypothetical protein